MRTHFKKTVKLCFTLVLIWMSGCLKDDGGDDFKATPARRPEPPVLSALEDGSVKISWPLHPNSDYYKLYRKNESEEAYTLIFNAPKQEFLDAETKSGGLLYFYKLEACDNYGCSSSSDEGRVTTTPPRPEKPFRVFDADKHLPSPCEISFSWNEAQGADHYKIYRKRGGDIQYDQIDSVASSQPPKVDSYLTSSTKYYYKIAACDRHDRCSPKSEALEAITTPIRSREMYCDLKASGIDSNSIKVTFARVGGNGSRKPRYIIKRSEIPGGVYENIHERQETANIVKANGDISWTDRNLKSGSAYYYKMRICFSSCDCSEMSDRASASTAAAAPELYFENGFLDVYPYKIRLSWTEPTGDNLEYALYALENSSSDQLVNLSPIYRGLQNNYAYMDYAYTDREGFAAFFVKACQQNENGLCSPNSSELKVIFPASPLASPAGLSASLVANLDSSESVVISWTESPDSTDDLYYLYQTSESGVKKTYSGLRESPLRQNSVSERFYDYTIRRCRPNKSHESSVFNGGCSDKSSVFRLVVLDPNIIPPKLESVGGDILVSWKPVAGAQSYRLYRSLDPTVDYREISFVNHDASLDLRDSGLENATRYYYKLKAIRKDLSSDSAFASVITAPVAPVLNDPQIIKSSVRLSWTKVPGATSHEIYRAGSPDGEYERMIAGVAQTAWEDDKLMSGGVYYYKLTSCNGYGCSLKSADYKSIRVPEDAPDLLENAALIELNTLNTQKINRKNDIDYFKFEIRFSGFVRLLLSGVPNIVATLEDKDGLGLGSNQGGDPKSFKLSRKLLPGEYILKIEGGEQPGDYSFLVNFWEGDKQLSLQPAESIESEVEGNSWKHFPVSIATDSLNNIYISGYLNQNTTDGSLKGFLMKFNSFGKKEDGGWQIPELNYSEANNAVSRLNKSENHILYKQTGNMVADGDGVCLAGVGDASDGSRKVLIRYDSSGRSLWSKKEKINDNLVYIHKDIAADNLRNLYVLAYVYDNTNNITDNIILTKHNAAGEKIWTRTLGSRRQGAQETPDMGQALATDENNNVYISGYTWGNLVQPEATSDIYNKLFLAKYNQNGERQWIRQYDKTERSAPFVTRLAANNDHIYLGSFTPSVSSFYPYRYKGELFLSKIHSRDGERKSIKKLLETAQPHDIEESQKEGLYENAADFFADMAMDKEHNIYVALSSLNNMSETYDHQSTGIVSRTEIHDTDVVLLKYNLDAEKVWSRQIGSPSYMSENVSRVGQRDSAAAIAINSAGNVYIAGHTDGNLYDFIKTRKVTESKHANLYYKHVFLTQRSSSGDSMGPFWQGDKRRDGYVAEAKLIKNKLYAVGRDYRDITLTGYHHLSGVVREESLRADLPTVVAGLDVHPSSQFINSYVVGYSEGGRLTSGQGYLSGVSGGGDHIFLVVFHRFFLNHYENKTHATSLGGTGNSRAFDVSALASYDGHKNDIYIAGCRNNNMLLLKYEYNNLARPPEKKWSKEIPSSSFACGYATEVDKNAVYVGGQACGVFEGRSTSGNCDAVLLKYQRGYPEDIKQWTKFLGGPKNDKIENLGLDAQGNIYAVGYTGGGMLNMAETPIKSGYDIDAFLSKHGPDGALLWVKQLGTFEDEIGFAVTLDKKGNIYIAGHTKGHLEKEGVHRGGKDAFLAKYSSAGAPLWKRQIGDHRDNKAIDLVMDTDEEIYVIGYDTGKDFNVYSQQTFIIKYNSQGEKL